MISAPEYNPTAPMPRPYFEFSQRAMEDRNASVEAGHMLYKEIDFVTLRAPGNKDSTEKAVSDWLEDLKHKAKQGMIPVEWPSQYAEAYRQWKAGNEIPLNGTPIKTWPVATPGQVKNLLAINILTVEDLAQANENTISRLGLGGVALRDLAKNYLKAGTEKGKQAQEMTALQVANKELLAKVEQLTAQVAELAKAAATPPKV